MRPRTITIDGVTFPLRHLWYALDPTDPAPQPDELLASVVGNGTRVGTVYLIITSRRINSTRHCRYQLAVVAAPELQTVACLRPDGVYVRDVKAHPLYWVPRYRR